MIVQNAAKRAGSLLKTTKAMASTFHDPFYASCEFFLSGQGAKVWEVECYK